MTPNLEQKLLAKVIFSEAKIWCKDGWFELLNDLCELITKDSIATGLRTNRVIEAKEKFGCLVVHTRGSNYTAGVCAMAHACSAYICDTCGSLQGELGRAGPSIMTRCPRHQEDPWSEFEAGPKVIRQIDIPGHPVLELAISRLMTKRPKIASVTFNPASVTPFLATIDEKAEVYWQEIARGAIDFAANFYRKYE